MVQSRLKGPRPAFPHPLAVMAQSLAAGMGLGQCFAIVSNRAGQHLALSLAGAVVGFAVPSCPQGMALGITTHISLFLGGGHMLRLCHGRCGGLGL